MMRHITVATGRLTIALLALGIAALIGAPGSQAAARTTSRSNSAEPQSRAPAHLASHVYGISGPLAISADGKHVWVANTNGNSVTELSAATGGLVRVIKGADTGIAGPDAIYSDGSYVWVANGGNNSITVLSATDGSVDANLNDPSYMFDYPDGIGVYGSHVWIANASNNSVTEMKRTTGALIQVITGSGLNDPSAIVADARNVWVTNRKGSVTDFSESRGLFEGTISSPSDHFADPTAIADDGSHLWVTNNTGNSVTELYSGTGVLLRVLNSLSGGAFLTPVGIASDGAHVWIVSSGLDQLSEIQASTGVVLRVVSGATYGLNGPVAIALDTAHIWITNYRGNSVTELSKTTGSLVRVIHG